MVTTQYKTAKILIKRGTILFCSAYYDPAQHDDMKRGGERVAEEHETPEGGDDVESFLEFLENAAYLEKLYQRQCLKEKINEKARRTQSVGIPPIFKGADEASSSNGNRFA